MDRVTVLTAIGTALALAFILVAVVSIATIGHRSIQPKVQVTAAVLAGLISITDTIRGLDGGGWFAYLVGGLWAGLTVLWVWTWDHGVRTRRQVDAIYAELRRRYSAGWWLPS